MPDHQPGAPEDLLHLVGIDRLIAEDAAVELAGGGIDDNVLPSGAHTRLLPLAVMIAGAADGEPRCDFFPARQGNRAKIFTIPRISHAKSRACELSPLA